MNPNLIIPPTLVKGERRACARLEAMEEAPNRKPYRNPPPSSYQASAARVLRLEVMEEARAVCDKTEEQVHAWEPPLVLSAYHPLSTSPSPSPLVNLTLTFTLALALTLSITLFLALSLTLTRRDDPLRPVVR